MPGPAVWAIEDIHWASGDVLAFLAAAARAPAQSGRLILATARASILERLDGTLERLELHPLPPRDAARFVTELVGEALPPGLVAAIEERSDGNPLFIEELLRSWVGVGTLESVGGRWRLTRPPGAIALPATVQAIDAGRLDDLPAPVRDVARKASAAGRRFPVDALAKLGVESPEAGVEEMIARALVSGPIADSLTGASTPTGMRSCATPATAAWSRAHRARLHIRLARWLESISR